MTSAARQCAGRVDKLLLSGGHSRVDYDEVGAMLLADGPRDRRASWLP